MFLYKVKAYQGLFNNFSYVQTFAILTSISPFGEPMDTVSLNKRLNRKKSVK